MSGQPQHVWEGVYPDFAAAAALGEIFSDPRWIDHARAQLRAARAGETAYGEHLLPVIAATAAGSEGRVTVLDFGGGPGNGFVPLARAIVGDCDVEFHVVDGADICRLGEEAFAEDPRIRFHVSLPELPGGVDIVHLGSALHYVDDWRGMVDALAAYDPEFILMSDVPVGNIPSFVTAQRYYDAEIPVWFWNIDELTGAFEAAGYGLRFKANFTATIPGNPGPLNMDNMPKGHRIKYWSHLLFARRTPRGSPEAPVRGAPGNFATDE